MNNDYFMCGFCQLRMEYVQIWTSVWGRQQPECRTGMRAVRQAELILASFDDSDQVVCGVDEAGRGPLAGPVFAAAVILDPAHPIAGLRDSKKLSEARRDQLALEIRAGALAWSIASCSEQEIDTLNILQATMLAMRRAVEGLAHIPDLALIDGNRCPPLKIRAQAIVKGDATVPAISAASILAKTARDAALYLLHQQYPRIRIRSAQGLRNRLAPGTPAPVWRFAGASQVLCAGAGGAGRGTGRGQSGGPDETSARPA